MSTGTCAVCGTGWEAEPGTRLTCLSCGTEIAVPPAGEPTLAAALAAAPPPVEGAACAVHPGMPATKPCPRCGDYLCETCETRADGRTWCVTCYEHKFDQGEFACSKEGFVLPRYSMWMGIVSIFTFWAWCSVIPLAATAFTLGVISIQKIRRRPALQGRKQAIAGMVTSGIAFAACVGYIAFQVWLMARMRERPGSID